MSWNSRGLRGSTLEALINRTNEQYAKKGLAVIQKVPTPIVPIKIDKNRRIIDGYFEQKSTVDYIGAVQGIPICFDAKETTRKILPIQNIHTHQIEFMKNFELQKGIAFLLVSFRFSGEYFLLPFNTLYRYWSSAQIEGRKSISYTDFDKELIVKNKYGFFIHYLEALDILLSRD